MVEYSLAKAEVEGSSPFYRSFLGAGRRPFSQEEPIWERTQVVHGGYLKPLENTTKHMMMGKLREIFPKVTTRKTPQLRLPTSNVTFVCSSFYSQGASASSFSLFDLRYYMSSSRSWRGCIYFGPSGYESQDLVNSLRSMSTRANIHNDLPQKNESRAEDRRENAGKR